jgi:acetyl-CoA carboxylase biotin carboxyl carrier protein
VLDLDELRRIIRLLKDEGLSEITVAEGENRITVRRETGPSAAPVPQRTAASSVDVPPQDEGTFMVTAPLIGTFYSRPAPDADPYISPGSRVKPGDTLCVIEAMKVLNEIKAEAPGRLEQVLVEDGETVEYGAPLFLFEKE